MNKSSAINSSKDSVASHTIYYTTLENSAAGAAATKTDEGWFQDRREGPTPGCILPPGGLGFESVAGPRVL